MVAAARIVVQPLRDEFLADVVRIHQAGLGYTLNSQLGAAHLTMLYQAMRRDRDCFVGVALLHGRPVGIVSGAIDPNRFRSSLMKSIPLQRLLSIGLRVILRPWLVIRLWQGNLIAAPVRDAGQDATPTLTAIAVDPDVRGQGIGKELVAAIEDFFHERKIDCYRLDTLVTNKSASAFYRGLGFREVAERAGSLIFTKEIDR